MWTILTCLLLALTLNPAAARSSVSRKDVGEEVNGTEPPVDGITNGPARFPSKFPQEDIHIKRLHIRNQTGFDGKVRSIRFNADVDEDRPGVRAYGMQKKQLEDSGLIERIPLEVPHTEDLRNSRLILAYGMSKPRLENNGDIERITIPASTSDESRPDSRHRETRSIDAQSDSNVEGNVDKDLEDLEAQSAKVFRPLFVYRKQQAKKQRLHHARNNPQNLYHDQGKFYKHYGAGLTY